MPSPALSVIIPTHLRPDTLAQCLAHLAAQTVADSLEIIVIDDAHDARTEKACSAWHAVRYLTVEPCQQGAARNRGVALASADIVWIIGDDIFPDPAAGAVHRDMHRTQEKPAAVLGFTTWDPSVGVTATMTWLEQSGWQFGYPHIARYAGGALPRHLQHRYTYTSNISLPTRTAREHPFREDISLYGWEDIEWGLRLAHAEIPLLYAPDAAALHHHRMTEEASLRRMEELGRSVETFARIVPDFDRLPRGWKRWAYACAARLPTRAGRHRAAFLRGVRTAAVQSKQSTI